jgi:hypothetical protein
MATNFQPPFPLTPNVGSAVIPTANAQVKSTGTSAGTGADLMYKVFTAGANGSFVSFIRFYCVATALTTSVATCLRAYRSTVASPGATAVTDTFLLGEVTAPAITTAGSTTTASTYFDIPVNAAIPTGQYIHVSQAVAQTTNQNWNVACFGGDY